MATELATNSSPAGMGVSAGLGALGGLMAGDLGGALNGAAGGMLPFLSANQNQGQQQPLSGMSVAPSKPKDLMSVLGSVGGV